MSEENQGEATGTQTEGQGAGTENKNSQNNNSDDVIAKLSDPDVQSEIDRRVTAAVKKRDAENAIKAQEAAEKARKEAEEQKLLEDGKLQELVEIRSKEAEEAKSKLEKYERDLKIDALLDKQEILDPNMRAIFKATGMDLTELNPMVEGFKEQFDTAVQAEVNKRLKTDPPPKGQTTKDAGDLDSRIKAAMANGDFQTSMILKREKMAQMRQ